MKREMTEIRNRDLKKGLFKNAQFIFFSAEGAMGEGGAIVVVTSGGSIFHGNYSYGDIKFDKLLKVLPALNEFCNADDIKDPEGWSYEYLEAGNNLLIRNDICEEFRNKVKNDYHDDMICWLEAAIKLIEKQNIGKAPEDIKTKEELALVRY